MVRRIRVLLWILAVYFSLSMAVLMVSSVDLPPAFYALSILVLPLLWLGRLLEPVLSMFGLWSDQGPGGWVNYEGANFGGLLLLAVVGLAVTGLLLLYSYNKGN